MADYPPLDLLVLFRDQLRDILDLHDMAHPRVVGLAAKGEDLPESFPVEVLVDMLDAHERAALDLVDASREVSALIGHRVILVHCPRGRETLLEGERMVTL